ncbi:MAG: PDZ domain-containing protein, partial [Planctomycetes bacterium]|nr:PDZ domain-containing protein [Planctomycetota bacterium]
MEKRFALFLGLSALILIAHLTLQSYLAPPQPDRPQGPQDVADVDASTDDEDAAAPDSDVATGEPESGEIADASGDSSTDANTDSADQEAEISAASPDTSADVASDRPEVARQWVVLGSLAPSSPYRLVVTLCNQGGSIERIELVEREPSGRFRFNELVDKSGYLGHLALRDETACRVNVVPPGSPAALAAPSRTGVEVGLKTGDIVQQIDGQPVSTPDEFRACLGKTKPGRTVEIQVSRSSADGKSSVETFTALLTKHPLSIVSPERNT